MSRKEKAMDYALPIEGGEPGSSLTPHANFPMQSPIPANVAGANPNSRSGLALGGRRAFQPASVPMSPDAARYTPSA